DAAATWWTRGEKPNFNGGVFAPLEEFDMAATTHVRYHGVVFELDLDVVREAITRHELSEGVTLGQFAEGAGVSRMAIWRLLAGHRVSLPTLARVLRALALNP